MSPALEGMPEKKPCPLLGPTCRGCPDCQGIPFDKDTDECAAEALNLLDDEEAERRSRYDWREWSEDDDGWDGDTGAPGILHFASAVSTWAFMQNRPVSVADAAAAFNVDPARVVEAMDEGVHLTFLTGPRDDFSKLMIEHDGE